MDCITLGGLLCSARLAPLSLEGTKDPPPGGPSAASPIGRFSWVLTHQAPAPGALGLAGLPGC